MEKSSAAKEPTDPPMKIEDDQDGGVGFDKDVDPITKGN